MTPGIYLSVAKKKKLSVAPQSNVPSPRFPLHTHPISIPSKVPVKQFQNGDPGDSGPVW